MHYFTQNFLEILAEPNIFKLSYCDKPQEPPPPNWTGTPINFHIAVLKNFSVAFLKHVAYRKTFGQAIQLTENKKARLFLIGLKL